MIKKSLSIIFFLMITGCQTIYFEKGSTEAKETGSGIWHHGGGLFALWEWNDPYDPARVCGGEWSAVKVDHDFTTGFVSYFVPYGIYVPWVTSARCGK
ncbi:MAG: hypothetical protein HQK54_11555 [Oligoflexales bacterium]|nr:hypothetical protein [Oligoflexales bacterium]